MVKTLHDLCTAFPPIDEQSFAELVEDIQRNGLREPIVLLGDQVLDGRNRYHACLEAGVQARFRDFGDDRGDGPDPVAFVLSKNLRRRHLTASQQAAAVAKTQDWSAAHPAHRPKEAGTGSRLTTAADRAAISGASERTQKDADLVARESPELLDKVIAGEVSAKAAARQVRASRAPENTVGVEGAPTAEDFDSAPPSDASADHDMPQAPAPAPKAVKAPPPADPRDARIAELEETVAELREALGMASDELDAYKAAAVNEDAVKAIRDRDALIEGLKSQSREWMTKCNELVRQIKAQQKVIKRLEAGR